jgi:N-acetyl-anhydromuramyl-L-alanine amidase AmpD
MADVKDLSPNTELTESGKEFIKEVCRRTGNDLFSGKREQPLPYARNSSGDPIDSSKTWTASVVDEQGNSITNADKLAEKLIEWFNTYGQLYNMDPNVLAAQAYVESGYKLWWYDLEPGDVTRSTTGGGISGLKMPEIYSYAIEGQSNILPRIADNDPFFIANLTAGLEAEASPTSYQPKDGDKDTIILSQTNRGALHQNIMDHPYIMIMTQARYMRYIADNCEKLGSTSLFCYKLGTKYMSTTYTRAIEKVKKDKSLKDNTQPFQKKGLDYVLKTFGVMGDKYNNLGAFEDDYKPKKFYFGLDILFNHVNEFPDKDVNAELWENENKKAKIDLWTYPNKNFDAWSANVSESDEYNLNEQLLDQLTIARDPRYKFIYFPSDQYVQEETLNKLQVVLHHTVSGGNDEDVGSDVRWWRSKGERVATAFIISRGGQIFQLFNTDFWAYHLGLTGEFIAEQRALDPNVKGNKELNQLTIGIEIDSWGGLIQGRNAEGVLGWYPTIMLNQDQQAKVARPGSTPLTNDEIVFYNEDTGYPKGFRGFFAFEKYTTKQIDSVADLILSLHTKFPEISLEYHDDMWDLTNKAQGCPGVSLNALQGNSGIWTHVSYRKDKSDCHPQQSLIDKLKILA